MLPQNENTKQKINPSISPLTGDGRVTGEAVREGVEVRGETRGDPPALQVVVVTGARNPPIDWRPCMDCSWAIACRNLGEITYQGPGRLELKYY